MRIYAADNNAEAILERERDVILEIFFSKKKLFLFSNKRNSSPYCQLHETLQRSGTNVARTAIAQALQCIKR